MHEAEQRMRVKSMCEGGKQPEDQSSASPGSVWPNKERKFCQQNTSETP